ncbi:O-antigen polymerase [Aerococcus urinaeequi]|uniref:O-antigen polymerase n=1 Tax=Aerococcus urinaeequi TaxID=51665 RepID=UPI003D6B6464
MFFLLAIIFVLVFFYNLNKIKFKKAPYIVKYFNIIWLVISLILYLNHSNLYLFNISMNYLYLTILTFMVSMNCGFILFASISTVRRQEVPPEESGYNVDRKYLYLILIFIACSLIIIYRESVSMVISGNLNMIRASIYDNEVGAQGSIYRSGLEVIFSSVILDNLIIALDIIIVSMYSKDKKNFALLLLASVVTVLSSILTGGRIKLLKLAIIILVSLFGINEYRLFRVDRERRDIKIKRKWDKMIVILIILALIVFIITFNRNLTLDTNSVFDTISRYVFSPILYYANLLDYVTPYVDPTYGGAFFGGILRFIWLILNNFGDFSWLYQFEMIQAVETSTFLEILPGQSYNAFPTMLYYFVRDGGLLAVVIDALLLSGVTRISFTNYNIRKSLRSESILLLVSYVLIFGAFRWEAVNFEPWFTIIFIIILTSPMFREKLKG